MAVAVRHDTQKVTMSAFSIWYDDLIIYLALIIVSYIFAFSYSCQFPSFLIIDSLSVIFFSTIMMYMR